MIENLTIDNFKIFKHLEIEKLGRVNLITGKNNVGKSCLLEAVKIYSEKGFPWELLDVLYRRNELELTEFRGLINEKSSELPLSFDANQILERRNRVGNLFNVSKRTSESHETKHQFEIRSSTQGILRTSLYVTKDLTKTEIVSEFNDEGEYHLSLVDNRISTWDSITWNGGQGTKLIPVEGLTPDQVSDFWDEIALTDRKEAIIASLDVFGENISDIAVTKEQYSSRRFPSVRLKNLKSPVPMKRLGDGVFRAFVIGTLLATSESRILLVDEIDTGLHHTVLVSIWKVIFDLSRQLDAQVFATTHNWDCIEAFAEAIEETQEDSAYLIRLNKDEKGIYPTIFDKEELYIATREKIEVR